MTAAPGPQHANDAHAAAAAHPFERLTPQAVLDALDAVGLRGDGRLLQLNSYENRVFQVFLEEPTAEGEPVVVAKFYRPGRWRTAQIAEEHAFAAELAAADVPVVAPLTLDARDTAVAPCNTLAPAVIGGETFLVAAYPRRSGHGPELDDPAVLRWLGRFIGRLHAVGGQRCFAERRTLDVATFGHAALARILALDIVPPAELPGWRSRCERALAMAEAAFAATPAATLRLHGDCHPGNILWRDDEDEHGRATGGPHIVDLDDAVNGPAVQDLWMLLSGSREAMRGQLAHVLAGYRQWRDFNARELALVEPLRTLRMVHHSAWIAERWTDPAFPAAFPWFASPGYWSQQAMQLGEQIEAMAEPPLDDPRA